jgi:hypothetical protein
MSEFRGSVVLGCANGEVYRVIGQSATLIGILGAPVVKMFSDGSALYIVVANNDSIYVFDGSNFTEVSI